MLRNCLKFIIPALVVGGAFGVFAGYSFAKKSFTDALGKTHSIRSTEGVYDFINPLLACDLSENKGIEEYVSLEKHIRGLVQVEQEKGYLDDASIYLMYKGRWVGVNENGEYEPAGLMKVVLMIAYFKESEQDATLFTRKLTYAPDLKIISDGSQAKEATTLIPGHAYTIDELVSQMMIKSDDVAMSILLTRINPNVLSDIYTDLGMETPDQVNNIYAISAKGYSLFFRILYNATYLNRTDSERALKLLSQGRVTDGLAASLPPETRVAHKYGERIITGEGKVESKEFHDCGIVYPVGRNTYFLCAMMRGKTVTGLRDALHTISSSIYTEVTK